MWSPRRDLGLTRDQVARSVDSLTDTLADMVATARRLAEREPTRPPWVLALADHAAREAVQTIERDPSEVFAAQFMFDMAGVLGGRIYRIISEDVRNLAERTFASVARSEGLAHGIVRPRGDEIWVADSGASIARRRDRMWVIIPGEKPIEFRRVVEIHDA